MMKGCTGHRHPQCSQPIRLLERRARGRHRDARADCQTHLSPCGGGAAHPRARGDDAVLCAPGAHLHKREAHVALRGAGQGSRVEGASADGPRRDVAAHDAAARGAEAVRGG